ncbi:cadherin-like protein [Keratinibaculum paraultunense]|uniref:Cadherin-like protein n=1 Tax=Keratinibaculum paraultunense TaxID=1278232 RepID=A0A4R3L377_9FIRM|nr:chitobiase/beta-hexosaminidase C-terminal domain-containing protein [Keratinibaculum paraultunense]QQY79924.1 chitobiase/beta-hexosaminidase C-terminal domain-containing protein [Keratinibaculum paraultunense]TCS91757.1 cadherin-like protein [Keratinibaculum paraultunense]
MKNKFVLFIMIFLILFSSIPIHSYAKGQVMEIDALFPDIKLKLEGNYISHKEVFIYDGELWVPMKDLANALKIDCSFNPSKRILNLNSRGKLNIKDTSLEPIAYQRGYEIQAKERRIVELDEEIRKFEGKRVNDSSKKVDALVRNIKVSFSDIDVFLDGEKIYLEKEPLIYNDDVYVSIIAISPVLYITPEINENIVNIDANAILVKKPYYNSIEKLISFRENMNKTLDRQLAELEKKKQILMDVKIPYEKVENLHDMRRYLNRHLGYIKDLPVSVHIIKGSNSWYYIDIEFSRGNYHKWKNLSRRDVESYVWDIFVALTSLYDEDAKIQGQIRNPYTTRQNYVEFNTYMRNIVFKFIDSGLDMKEKIDPVFIEDLLKKELGRYNREYFDYSARISGYDLELEVYPYDNRTFTDKWSIYTKISFLKEINYILRDYYPELRINGLVKCVNRDDIRFLIENGKLRSPELEQETEEFLNNKYGLFTAKTLKIPMKYKLHQISLDDYKLIVYMDFDINDSRWNKTMDEILGAFLQDVISEVIALWDMNIFLQAYDKGQNLVKEVVISQDIVQMVNAEPPSGEIVEGSTVTLYTNTPGATIYYTLDGSTPSPSNRILYTGPIVINEDTIIKAYAVKAGLKDSPVSTFIYTVVDDENIASGLDNLTVVNGRLEPEFNRRTFNYTVNVDYLVEKLIIIPKASKGSIEVNGEIVESGERKEIPLVVGQNKITIIHKEEGKKDRIYTIIVNRKKLDAPKVYLAPGYTFDTRISVIFRGNLASDTIRTFDGYKVKLLSRTGKHFKTVNVNSDGSFEIIVPPDEIDIIDKIIGFKYEIVDPNGVTLPENEDGNILQ